MTSVKPRDASDERRLVEAAAWRAHLHETDAQSSVAFEAWIAADPRNEAAWQQVSEPWDFFGEQAAAPELIDARRAALGRAQQAGRKRWDSPALRRRSVRYSIAAGLLVAALGSLFLWSAMRPDVYRTAAGERRVVTLSDGSQIALDSQSEVRVRYGEGARDLTLARGQARFDVARDVERPFSVIAGDQKIIATGTAFNVDLIDRRVLVTLIEGRVVVLDQRPPEAAQPLVSAPVDVVEPSKAIARRIELTAGQQLRVGAGSAPDVAAVNVERATAWQNGQLVFEDEPLSSVIERINRYSRQPLSLSDEQTAALRISGVFNTGDVGGFVSTLTHYLPVDAREVDGTIRISRR